MDIFLAHVDDAFKAHHGTCRGGGYSVLASAGLGDNAFLAEAFCQEYLSHGVIDLVSAGVGEVFSLEPDLWSALGSAELLAEIGGVIERRRSANVVGQEVGEFLPERLVFTGGAVGFFEFA